MRHFIPAIACWAVASGISIAGAVSWISNRRIKNTLKPVLILAACACLIFEAGTARHVYNSKSMGENFLKTNAMDDQLERFVQRTIPEDAGILMPNGYRTLFLEREVINENLLGVRQVRLFLLSGKTKRSIRETLLANGFDYLLIYRNKEKKFPKMFQLFLSDTKFTQKIFSNPLYMLFKIADPSEPEPEAPPKSAAVKNPIVMNKYNAKKFPISKAGNP